MHLKKCEKMHFENAFENAFEKNVKNAFQKCEKCISKM